jgi:hypothetical protein
MESQAKGKSFPLFNHYTEQLGKEKQLAMMLIAQNRIIGNMVKYLIIRD